MSYIIDTHTLIWIVTDSPRLSKKVKRIYLDKDNDILLSIASLWELAIKSSLEKITLGMPLDQFIDEHVKGNAIEIFDIRLAHVIGVEQLPFHHRDPFDRLIISQALAENFTVLGDDSTFDKYNVKRIW